MRLSVEGALVGRSTRPVQLVDLSQTGCLVQCETLLDGGAIFDLRLDLPSGAFTAKVRVVDASMDGTHSTTERAAFLAGLEFVGLPVAQHARLRAFLDEQRRRPQGADSPAR